MTRKRYIKLHMAAGQSRNGAAAIARAARASKLPYAADWVFYKAIMYRPVKMVDCTTFTPLMPTNLYTKIAEQIKKKSPAALSAELPAPILLPHRGRIYEVSLVKSGGYPLGGGGND